MNDFKEMTPEEARGMIARGPVTVVDIRDAASYEEGHLPNAINLNDESVEAFLASADRAQPVIVYCYHGISSRGAAQFLAEKGFLDVSSMSGGFAGWQDFSKIAS